MSEEQEEVVVVDKGVPIPDARNRSRIGKYQFEAMEEVGDSVLIAMVDGDARKTQRRASSAVQWARDKYPGRKFVTRVVEGGVRIWRTE